MVINYNSFILYRKRIFNLTPAIPNMASIPEDEDEESEYNRMNYTSCSMKSRRRDSVCSWNSANDSENEQVSTRLTDLNVRCKAHILIKSSQNEDGDIDINNSKPRSGLPDYLCLGEEVDRMDDFYSHYHCIQNLKQERFV